MKSRGSRRNRRIVISMEYNVNSKRTIQHLRNRTESLLSDVSSPSSTITLATKHSPGDVGLTTIRGTARWFRLSGKYSISRLKSGRIYIPAGSGEEFADERACNIRQPGNKLRLLHVIFKVLWLRMKQIYSVEMKSVIEFTRSPGRDINYFILLA